MKNDDFKIPDMFPPIKSTIKIEWQRENIWQGSSPTSAEPVGRPPKIGQVKQHFQLIKTHNIAQCLQFVCKHAFHMGIHFGPN